VVGNEKEQGGLTGPKDHCEKASARPRSGTKATKKNSGTSDREKREKREKVKNRRYVQILKKPPGTRVPSPRFYNHKTNNGKTGLRATLDNSREPKVLISVRGEMGRSRARKKNYPGPIKPKKGATPNNNRKNTSKTKMEKVVQGVFTLKERFAGKRGGRGG